MRLFRPLWVWLVRFRKRRGYGIHSPFAYAFVRGVVLETWPYYAYERLARLHPWWVRWFRLSPLRCRRLLFRLANYVEPSSFCLLGSMAIEREYIRAAVPSAREVSKPPADFVLISTDCQAEAAAIASQMPENGMMVIEGIRRDRASTAAWHTLQNAPHTGITFDLYTYGIVLFDHHLHKQHYIINF